MDAEENSTQIVSDNVAEPDAGKVTSKKPFVEPEISAPVDVLEATTFQAVVTTGATN